MIEGWHTPNKPNKSYIMNVLHFCTLGFACLSAIGAMSLHAVVSVPFRRVCLCVGA